MPDTTTPRFVALDSWRGIAAICVALLHFSAYSHIDELDIRKNAAVFVDLFFVLSGFVITWSYQDRIAKGFSIADFMRRRFWRIYPLHFVMTLMFLGLEAARLVFDGMFGGRTGDAFSPAAAGCPRGGCPGGVDTRPS